MCGARLTTTLAAVVSVSAIVAVPTSAQFGGVDVRVNQDPPGMLQNETSMTLNPMLPGNIVIAYNDYPYAPGCPGLGISFSLDGGQMWADRQLPLPPGMLVAFDPISAADTQGIVYAGYIATDNVAGGQSCLYIHGSADGGATWPPAMMTQVVFNPTTLNDKPHMAVDRSGASPFQDWVHVAWIWEPGGGPWSDIHFACSTPGGANFTPRQQVSDLPTGVGMGNGPNIATATDGTVYLAWLDCDVTTGGQVPGVLMIDRSYDGGVTWGPDTAVRTILTLPSFLSDGWGGQNVVARSYPCIAVSPQNPLEVYMVYAEDPDGPWTGDEADVFFISSYDGGMTWNPPLLLNVPPANQHQFEPWIDVKPNGIIDVAWYDGGLIDDDTILWAVMLTRSTDGGVTWTTPMPVSDVPFYSPVNPWGQAWMGEYLGLVVDQNDAYIAFTSSVTDGFGDIYFDRIPNEMIGAWVDSFDRYLTNVRLPDQSSWESWDDDPTAANFYVSTAQARSAPQSLAIDDNDDAVHRFSGHTSGRWTFTAWQYITSAMNDQQYFILLNTYPADIGTPSDWSTQIEFDGATGQVNDYLGTNWLPMVRDAWAEIRVEIDLDQDTQSVYYNGAHLVSEGWSDGVEPGGALEIAAVDLWASGSAHEVYYDDMSLAQDLTPPCPEDLTGDGVVNVFDLLQLLAAWGMSGVPEDLTGDGIVNVFDLLQLLGAWGQC